VVGADSATAAVLAAGLVGIAKIGTPEYVTYASLLALMAGALLILARIVKLGFLADFLSRTVLVGFLTGVGFQVAVAQVPAILGLPTRAGLTGPIQALANDAQRISQTNLYTLTISIVVFLIILMSKRISKKVPGPLIAVIGAILVSSALNLPSRGVSVLGTIPSGLPAIGLPRISLSVSLIEGLLPIAFSMFIIILTQSSATSQAYATRYSEHVDENLDLVGLGIANLGAALSGTFVVNGSPTKTQMVDSAGGTNQLAQLTTVTVVVAVLLFLTGPLAYMPTAALAAIVFVIAWELVDIKGMRAIFRQRRSEFWVALITAGTVFFVGVEQGILFAIFLSILDHTRHGYRPRNMVISIDDTGDVKQSPVSTGVQCDPGLIIYHFNHSMYYANSGLFSEEVINLVNGADPSVSWFCLDATSIDDVDFSAAATLRETYNSLKQRGIRFVFTELEDNVREELDRYGIAELVGEDAFFDRLKDVQSNYKRHLAVGEVNLAQ
jgi:SulP family sulfate permease